MLPLPPYDNLISIFRICSRDKILAIQLLAGLRSNGLRTHRQHGNSLVSLLVEVETIDKALRVFNSLIYRSELSWNSLIIGCIKCNTPGNAIALYRVVSENAFQLNEFAFVALLKACIKLNDLNTGCEIHGHVARKGFLDSNIIMSSILVDMYAKLGKMVRAEEAFENLPIRDVVSWTTLISGYMQNKDPKAALCCFDLMKDDGVSPNAATFALALKACGSIGAKDLGSEIHLDVLRMGLLKKNQIVGNALVDMYSKCGLLDKAKEIFDMLPYCDIVAWTSLISGYSQRDLGKEALNCYKQMQLRGISPDNLTFASCLKACGSIQDCAAGREIHAEIERKFLLQNNVILGAALVDMYSKCGILDTAQEVFERLPIQDKDTWNALIAGYAQHDYGERALKCFEEMQVYGVQPDSVTLACCLKACGTIGAIERGEEMHADIDRVGLLKTNQIIGNTLVDMYAKLGMLSKAEKIFYQLDSHDVISWNALLTGYAQIGEFAKIVDAFSEMVREDVKPNAVTYLSVLHSCSHIGLIEKGEEYFTEMSEKYGIIPTIEHCTCMVDLFGNAGQLGRAVEFMRRVPAPDMMMLLTMLGACRKWNNVCLAKQAFEQAVQLDENDPAPYVCMSNIYANVGMHRQAKMVKKMRNAKSNSVANRYLTMVTKMRNKKKDWVVKHRSKMVVKMRNAKRALVVNQHSVVRKK